MAEEKMNKFTKKSSSVRPFEHGRNPEQGQDEFERRVLQVDHPCAQTVNKATSPPF